MSIQRLTSTDLTFLRLETPEWPCHFGGLAVLEGAQLLDDSGNVRLEEICRRLEPRLVRDLRQRVQYPGLLRGRPLWVDDHHFAIERHVHQIEVRAPGGTRELLDTATRCYERPLDRSKPLWELWFLTGLADNRIGMLLKVHHAVADGHSAVAIMGSLFDVEPDAPDPDPASWTPEPMPTARQVLADNINTKLHSLVNAIGALARPRQLVAWWRAAIWVTMGGLGKGAAPASPLNRRVGVGRRVCFDEMPLQAMRNLAHAHDGKINDVVLALFAGGVRRLLQSRGEPVSGVALITGLSASLRSDADDGEIDNRVGTIVLPLPVWEPAPHRRLDLVVETTSAAKADQLPAVTMGFLAGLAATPLGRFYTAHQRATNVIVTNVAGPPIPMYLLGARTSMVIPIMQLLGNIGLTLCAFSYAGKMFMVVTGDAGGFPDLDVLMEGIAGEWDSLAGVLQSDPS